jgi:hypothetical protein
MGIPSAQEENTPSRVIRVRSRQWPSDKEAVRERTPTANRTCAAPGLGLVSILEPTRSEAGRPPRTPRRNHKYRHHDRRHRHHRRRPHRREHRLRRDATHRPEGPGEYPDHDKGIALLREVVAEGVTFIDTADVYGPQQDGGVDLSTRSAHRRVKTFRTRKPYGGSRSFSSTCSHCRRRRAPNWRRGFRRSPEQRERRRRRARSSRRYALRSDCSSDQSSCSGTMPRRCRGTRRTGDFPIRPSVHRRPGCPPLRASP